MILFLLFYVWFFYLKKISSLTQFLQLLEQNSRPSSADSSHSNSNAPAMGSNAPFKDILAQFAKMTPAERQLYSSNNSIISALNMTTQAASQGSSSTANNNNNNKPPPYPEVTLHPVASDNGSSLLHGILTKVRLLLFFNKSDILKKNLLPDTKSIQFK